MPGSKAQAGIRDKFGDRSVYPAGEGPVEDTRSQRFPDEQPDGSPSDSYVPGETPVASGPFAGWED